MSLHHLGPSGYLCGEDPKPTDGTGKRCRYCAAERRRKLAVAELRNAASVAPLGDPLAQPLQPRRA